MFTNPQPNDQLTERMSALETLFSRAHHLSRAVLALQFTENMQLDPDTFERVQEIAIRELYEANDMYLDAYAKAFPKPGSTEGQATE